MGSNRSPKEPQTANSLCQPAKPAEGMVWLLLGKKGNQNLSKTRHSPNKCCQRNNTKTEPESEMLLVLGLGSCLRKNGKDCDSHGGTVTGQVREPGVRANLILGHDQKVLQELSSLSCQCLDKTRHGYGFLGEQFPKFISPSPGTQSQTQQSRESSL